MFEEDFEVLEILISVPETIFSLQMCKRINATVKRIKTSLLKDFEDGKSRFEVGS